MITGSQCRAARALVELDRTQLSDLSGVDADAIRAFERQLAEPPAETVTALARALERVGAVFIAENGGGIGVRLKFTASESRRIRTLEGEGGITGSDDVP
ncbi:MAG: helix-turn-helix domain-containing protein [Rhizobiaceae bacterium]|nr:helix-turn-helix domain-containing protein [Rhizobiaceae bacterium]MCV0408022.1 helix-turn-helix domain-containing protein [Rhizobiaceae bacterium]